MYWHFIVDFFHPTDSLLGLHVTTSYNEDYQTDFTIIHIGILLINFRLYLGKKQPE